jgi:transcriptional regulator with XRE-family HTH domain
MAVLPLLVVSLSDGHSLVLFTDELIQVYTFLIARPVYPQGWKSDGKPKNSTIVEKHDIMKRMKNPKRRKVGTVVNVALTIQERLKDLRVERGLTLEQLEQQTGISKSALGSYENADYKDITHTSIVTLAKFYGVSADYLLGLTETKNHPNADLSELRLSDEMIGLLKSGKINTRLLCEMAAHRDFAKLLADVEIYVDGVASMQVRNLNAWVDMVRNEIVEKYHPGENDPTISVLKAAHIEEDIYFRNIVNEDMDCIIRDIREAHKGDSTSAPDTTAVDEIKNSLDEAARFHGSNEEKRVVVFCRQLGIDYPKLTPEEFRVIIKVLEKSKLLKIPRKRRRRGKWK